MRQTPPIGTGGEEIAVLLRETGLEDAAQCAEWLRAAVAGIRLPEQPEVKETASAGVAARHTTMAHDTELVAMADSSLYVAKQHARDRVAVTAAEGENAVAGPSKMRRAARPR